ncbi:MAG: ABC transporter ATP-binding protein [Desulfobacteraceae bacterium]
MVLLEIDNLASGYGEVQILWGVSLSLAKGHLTTLVGSNGVGKTTLLRTIMGLLRPGGGTITFAGRNITYLSPHRRANQGLVLVPEGRQLFTDMSVAENLEMGAFCRRARLHCGRNLERVFDLFPRLKERRHQAAGTLSGGEQQMVAVARGLMAEPEILMLDEPSLGLSPLMSLKIFEGLRRLKSAGLTMLLVEQNVAMALAVSDYAYVLSQGRICLAGPAAELSQNKEIQRTYLGI